MDSELTLGIGKKSMTESNKKIMLNEILKFENLHDVKIRFNLMFNDNWDTTDIFKNADTDTMLNGQYWNYKSYKSYKQGQVTIGFLRLKEKNLWLLFHIGRVTKDLNVFDGVGYEHEVMQDYEKYFGRLIIKFKNNSQTMIRLATSVINECEVVQILPDTFDNDIFPGYDKVRLSWSELRRVIEKEGWRTALQNQKGVYLITDISNGKMYIGSAYGDNMILGRWNSYIKSGHGNNVELKKITFEYIQKNFEYSILDIFKSTVDDKAVIDREIWWKNVLKTREFGYNLN
jgi:hypothetical protein